MSKSFEIELREKPEDLFARTRKTAHEGGWHFDGDTNSGNIAGQGFQGTYIMDDRKILVTIHKKPALIPWFIIESKIRQFLA